MVKLISIVPCTDYTVLVTHEGIQREMLDADADQYFYEVTDSEPSVVYIEELDQHVRVGREPTPSEFARETGECYVPVDWNDLLTG